MPQGYGTTTTLSLRGGGGDDADVVEIGSDDSDDGVETGSDEEAVGILSLRGGGPSTGLSSQGTQGTRPSLPPQPTSITSVWISGSPITQWIPLYGFQGIVHFHAATPATFIDAAARLLDLPGLSSDVFTVTMLRKNQPVATFIFPGQDRAVTVAALLGLWHKEMRVHLFATKDGLVPPAEPLVPSRPLESRILRCRLVGNPRDDVAYLRIPDTKHLHHNHYWPWIVAVARILTPGTKVDAPGTQQIPHCFFAPDGGDIPVDTYGGVGFLPYHWGLLVKALEEGKPDYNFRMQNVGFDLGILIPGAMFGAGGPEGSRYRLANLAGAIKRINIPKMLVDLVEASLNADGKQALTGIELFCPGEKFFRRNGPGLQITKQEIGNLTSTINEAVHGLLAVNKKGWIACRPTFSKNEAILTYGAKGKFQYDDCSTKRFFMYVDSSGPVRDASGVEVDATSGPGVGGVVVSQKDPNPVGGIPSAKRISGRHSLHISRDFDRLDLRSAFAFVTTPLVWVTPAEDKFDELGEST